MTGNVVISEVDAIMYVVLSKAKKTRALWGIGGTGERIAL